MAKCKYCGLTTSVGGSCTGSPSLEHAGKLALAHLAEYFGSAYCSYSND